MTNRAAFSFNIIHEGIIENLVNEAFTIINNNAFVKKNLSTYIIQRQQQTLFNVARQELFIPNQCNN